MTIEIEIEAEGWSAAGPDLEAVVTRAARAALNLDPARSRNNVVVLLTDDDTVRDLNHRFRGKDRPTNVLSFPGVILPGQPVLPADQVSLGDIVLALGVCSAEANEQGKTLSSHLTHLVVHGVLHLLGRDHMTDPEAEAMEAEERVVLAELGISDPYELPHEN